MAGINRALYEMRHTAKLHAAAKNPCIFISHISVDKDAAIAVAKYIMKNGNIDVYLDIQDDDLQTAVETNDHDAITNFIERGLTDSTDIMCLVSADTARSWWVPYELGFAKHADRNLATLKLKGDIYLPSYLRVSRIIMDIDELNQYLRRVQRRFNKISASTLTESLIPNTESHPLDDYLDWSAEFV